jgi:hypothetical protein
MDAGELYGLPLERFVPERTALSKLLRSQGQRDDAAAVAKLAKPSVAAWAVNQLVRTQHRAVAELFDAGDALQRAQAEVIAGRGSASGLREAADRERAAVRALGAAARGLLTAEGHGLTPATLERVTETLHAAALDESARQEVREGCLTRELKHIGLGAVQAVQAGEAPRPRPTRPARAQPRSEQTARAASEARERAVRLEAARKAETEARRTAERTATELERAQEQRERAAASLREAEQTLHDAEQALREAKERAAQAARAHERARRALERA